MAGRAWHAYVVHIRMSTAPVPAAPVRLYRFRIFLDSLLVALVLRGWSRQQAVHCAGRCMRMPMAASVCIFGRRRMAACMLHSNLRCRARDLNTRSNLLAHKWVHTVVARDMRGPTTDRALVYLPPRASCRCKSTQAFSTKPAQ